MSTRNQLTTALSSWRRTQRTKRSRSDNDMFVFRMIPTGNYIKSGSLMYSRIYIDIYAVVDILMYLWWLRPVVSAVCMLKMSSPLGHPFAAHTITCNMQPIILTVATTNSLYMTTDDYKACSRLPLCYCTQLVTSYLFSVFLYHMLYYSCYSLYTHTAALPPYINQGGTCGNSYH